MIGDIHMPSQRSIALKEAVALFIADRKSRGFSANTLRFYRDKLGLFTRWCIAQESVSLDAVTPHTVRAYFAYLIDRGNSQGAQNAAGRGIKTFLRWCEAEELTQSKPL